MYRHPPTHPPIPHPLLLSPPIHSDTPAAFLTYLRRLLCSAYNLVRASNPRTFTILSSTTVCVPKQIRLFPPPQLSSDKKPHDHRAYLKKGKGKTMFFKQYNYKPRSGSQSSQSGSGSAIEPTDNAARAESPPAKPDTASTQANTSPVSAAIAGRRRVKCPFLPPQKNISRPFLNHAPTRFLALHTYIYTHTHIYILTYHPLLAGYSHPT